MSAVPLVHRSCSNRHVAVEWIALPTGSTPLEVRIVSRDLLSATVQLVGEIDVVNAGAVGEVLAGQIARGRRFVRLDVSGLTFCDCAGLAAMVRAHNALLTHRGTLVLVGVGAALARLFWITHLDEALLVADGPGDAPHVRKPCAGVHWRRS